MDAGSRLVAELASVAGQEAMRIWDCCAAPGGKTLVMAKRLPAAHILATDVSPVRLKRLQERLVRTSGVTNISTESADAAKLPASFGEFDLILCDVPCSGTGTLARNPEIRHRLRGDELRRHAERQYQILTGAVDRLAKGGTLVYSTCSLEAEECELVVKRLLGEKGDRMRKRDIKPLVTELEQREILARNLGAAAWFRDEALRTLPGVEFQGDGFFAALLERT